MSSFVGIDNRRRHLLAGRSEATTNHTWRSVATTTLLRRAKRAGNCPSAKLTQNFSKNPVLRLYMHKYTQKHDFSTFQNFRFLGIFAHFWCWCQSRFGYRLLYLKNFSIKKILKIPRKHRSTLFWILNRYSMSNELYRPPFFRILKKSIFAKIEVTRV